jgi:hypothetical protein
MENTMKKSKYYAFCILMCGLVLLSFASGTSTYSNVAFSYESTSLRDGLYPLKIELFPSSTSDSPLWFFDTYSDTSTLVPVYDGKISFHIIKVPSAVLRDVAEVWVNASYLGIQIAPRTLAEVDEPITLEDLEGSETEEAAAVGLEIGVSSEDVYFASNRVGIGTTSPTEVLDVIGNVKATSFVGNGTQLTQIYNLDANDANPQNALYVDNSGNVGIGTTAPAINLQVAGDIRVGDCTTCSSANAGAIRYNSTLKKVEYCDGSAWSGIGSSSSFKGNCVYRWTMWSNYNQWNGWFAGNNSDMYGGVAPSNWCDGSYRAYNMSSDKNLLCCIFPYKGYAKYNTLVYARQYRFYSSTEARFCGALFRIKNSSGSAQTWTPYCYYSCYASWSNWASMSINGNELWYDNNNRNPNMCRSTSVTLPANQTSTVIVLSSMWMGCDCSWHWASIVLAFYNNSLQLPTGCEYVDDLDVASNGWNY